MSTRTLNRPLKSVRIHAGQGDVLMAVSGLQALIELGADVFAADACVYSRTDTVDLVQALLPNLKIVSLQQSKHVPKPRYIIVQHLSWTTTLRNWFTRDWYVNFNERRLLASYGYPKPSIARRAQLFLTDVKFRASRDWRRETPSYYGIKMWAPLARTLGYTEIDLGRAMYAAHRTLRARLLAHAAKLPPRAPVPAVAFFPSGRGFQYLPPAFIRALVQTAGIQSYACYFGPKDPTAAEYAALGLECRVTASTDELLRIVTSAAVTATSDSFVSHVAQLAAREHVALMSHDIPLHTIHPAAASHVVFTPLPCSPCFYTIRETGSRCQAGRDACGVFVAPDYTDKAVATLASASKTAS